MGHVPLGLVFQEKHGEFTCPRCGARSPRMVATVGLRSYEQCSACAACHLVHREWLFRFTLCAGPASLAAVVLRFLLPAVVNGLLTPVNSLIAFAFATVCTAAILFRPLRRLLQLRYVGRLAT